MSAGETSNLLPNACQAFNLTLEQSSNNSSEKSSDFEVDNPVDELLR